MKDEVLILKDEKVTVKRLPKIRTKITQKYWLGWAGRYGTPKKM